MHQRCSFDSPAIALALLLTLTATGPAQADLLEGDLDVPDDGLVTRDTETDLDWLDLPVTSGVAFSGFVGASGLPFFPNGWRHATTVEVCDLFDKLGAVPSPCPGSLQVTLLDVERHLDLLGPTFDSGFQVIHTTGLYQDTDLDVNGVGLAGVGLGGPGVGDIFVLENEADPLNAQETVGNFLVRPSQPPPGPPVKVHFGGTITEVDPLLAGFFEEGEAFDGFYIFDPTVPPFPRSSESSATYPQHRHAISRELHVGDYSFVAERYRISMRNDSLSVPGDSYDLNGSTRMSPVIPEAIAAATQVSVHLRDPDGNALSSTDLLEEVPALDDFATRELLILVTSVDCSSSSTCLTFLPVRGKLTRLPEPRASVLAAAALLTLGARRRCAQNGKGGKRHAPLEVQRGLRGRR